MSQFLDDFFEDDAQAPPDEQSSRSRQPQSKKKRWERLPVWIELPIIVALIALFIWVTPISFKDGKLIIPPGWWTGQSQQVASDGSIFFEQKGGNAEDILASGDTTGVTSLGLSETGLGSDGSGDLMNVDENSQMYAPMPSVEFENAQCETTKKNEVTSLPANSWSIPELGVSSQLIVSLPSQLPAAPYGVLHRDFADPASPIYGLVAGGHINYNSGYLSPYGYLHRATKCMRLYFADSSGQMHEYVLVTLMTVPQQQIESTFIYDEGRSGDFAMITCAGSYVGADGTNTAANVWFPYTHNLIADFQEITT